MLLKNINLYGNLISDTVFRIPKFKLGNSNNSVFFYKRLGGIANIEKGINLQSPIDIEVNMFNGDIANACIIEDGIQNDIRKSSIVNWGKQHINFDYMNGWNHISYLDHIDNKNNCLELKEIHSVDLCSSSYTLNEKEELFKLIPNINFLIISDNEFNALGGKNIIEILKNYLKIGLIIHFPSYIEFYSRNKSLIIPVTKYNKLGSILGAGDYFVSVFILSYLKSLDIEYSLKQCAEKTPDLILKANHET